MRFQVKVDDYEYALYATSETTKCFGCGDEGHVISACPNNRGHGTEDDPGEGTGGQTGGGRSEGQEGKVHLSLRQRKQTTLLSVKSR